MLEELRVANLGLLREARIEPGPGLVAVTGETGAGKTLLLGALRLLRGDPAQTDRIGPAGAESLVEGRFRIEDREMVAARRVTATTSRAYLDGAMSAAAGLGEAVGGSIEIVAQHEHLTLGRESSLRRLVDGVLDAAGKEARRAYGAAWEAVIALVREQEAIGGDPRALARDLDLLRHQAREIEAAGLDVDEEAELSGRLGRLRHAAEVAALLEGAHAGLASEDAAADRVRTALQALRSAASLDSVVGDLADRIDAIATDLEDTADEIRRSAEGLDLDPASLDAAERRAADIADLKRRYGDSLEEVLQFGEAAAARASQIEDLVERAESIEDDVARARTALAAAGEALLVARRRAAKELGGRAAGHLVELGFRDPVVSIDVNPHRPGAGGADVLELRFASDASLTPGPVGRVASGGELSRLVLAVRLAAGVGEAPIVAFDEIDAGIGGETALAMGEKLATLARDRQVLVVTHLPQVAAFAGTHVAIERSDDSATVRHVAGDERRTELARMLGGLSGSESGRSHADELLDLAASRMARSG